VFESIEHFKERVDEPDLAIDETSIMVLKGAGPKGYPGFPEVGNMPLRKKLLKRGITDVVRISDARMSATAYGTVVLHVAPEAAAGGPLALVKDGDMIELDVEKRRLHLDVADTELAKRRQAWKAAPPDDTRGYVKLYSDHVMQAHQGCDLSISSSARAAPRSRGSHIDGGAPQHHTAESTF
jgi:L-arabonate dehydrase